MATYSTVHIGHFSGQFSDTPPQWAHDAELVFKRGYAWITGTEAGESDNWHVLVAAATKYGYVIRRYKSNWVAVQRKIIKRGTFKVGVKTVVDTSKVVGPGHDTSYVWVSFVHVTKGIGKISVVASHYPTKGTPVAKDPARRVNLWVSKKIAKAVTTVMSALGRGAALAFYGGDQNIKDNLADTFFGGPVTSCWDEIEKWPSTGHSNIDVIASYDHDARVKCLDARALNDQKLFLHADHYLIEADYQIRHTA